MPKRRSRKPTQGELETQLLNEGRPRCKGPEWWRKYSDEELEVMQRRGRQLVEGGYGAVSWDELLGER